MIRVSLLLPRVNEELCASKDSARIIDTLLVCATDANSTPNQLLALRTLSNLFTHPVGEALAITNCPIILKALSNSFSANRNVQIAEATLGLNFAVSFCKEENNSNANLKIECLTSIISHLINTNEPEANFRHLVALGTLSYKDNNILNLLKNEETLKVLKKLSAQMNPAKVGKCAEYLLNIINR